MKNNEIRVLLRGKVDPDLGRVLISHNEDIKSLKQMVTQLASLIDKMADMMSLHTDAITVVRKEQTERFKRLGINVGSDPVLTGESDEHGR